MKFPQLLHDTLDLIYPPRCASCGDSSVGPEPFCTDCLTNLNHLCTTPSCPLCAAPIGQGAACPHCQGEGLYPFEQIVSLGPFRDPLRRMIHQMKYHHRWPVAEILADRLLAQDRVRNLLAQTDRLLSVPLHWSRHIARGYNQAESVAARLSSQTKVRLVRPIVRLKNTQTQTATHSKAERAENLRYAFGLVNKKAVHDQRVTLVDDVMTTAATLKSVARALEEAEPASISVIVLAVADPRRQDFSAV